MDWERWNITVLNCSYLSWNARTYLLTHIEPMCKRYHVMNAKVAFNGRDECIINTQVYTNVLTDQLMNVHIGSSLRGNAAVSAELLSTLGHRP